MFFSMKGQIHFFDKQIVGKAQALYKEKVIDAPGKGGYVFAMKKPQYRRTPSLMTTARHRFQFVVQFAALDLETFRRDDWETLKDALHDFLLPTHASLRPGGLHLWPTDAPTPYDMTPDDLRDLQAETRDVLTMVIASRAGKPELPYKPLPSLRYAVPHVPAGPDAAPGRHILSAQGKTRDLFFLGVFGLLADVNTATLARCPECTNVFLKKTNQVYCARYCKNKVAYRQYRERQAPALA